MFTGTSNDFQNVWKKVNDLMCKDDKSVISELVIDGEPCSGGPLANRFNEHALTVGDCGTTVEEISNHTYVTSNISSSVFMFPTSESEIYKL